MLPTPPPQTQATETTSGMGRPSWDHTSQMPNASTTAAKTMNTGPAPSPRENAAPVFLTNERSRTPGMNSCGFPETRDARTAAFVTWSTRTARTQTTQNTTSLAPRHDRDPCIASTVTKAPYVPLRKPT